eukprot:m.27622 g.27622  ORF g.27622 m.27622 type:complete len:189 (-) comp11764_c0_seq1:101-667(-)
MLSAVLQASAVSSIAAVGGLAWAIRHVSRRDVPNGSFLKSMKDEGYNCDTFVLPLPNAPPADLNKYIRAFFSSPVFQLERYVLQYAAGISIEDQDIRKCGFEVGDKLGVWGVTERCDNEALALWSQGSTDGCSWWRLEHTREGDPVLMFGSGIRTNNASKAYRLAMVPLTQGHYLYSRILLWSTGRNL